MESMGPGNSGFSACEAEAADEHRALDACQAIDPYINKPETMTFNYCCFAIAPATASWPRIQGGLR
jgi:hypothetical protein